MSALAWWTCKIAMACRAEAAWPQRYKLWPRERLSAYRPWMGDADGSSKRRRFVGTGAPRSRNQSSSREGSGLGSLLISSPMLTGPVRRWRQHPRGAAPPHLHPQRTWTHPPMLRSTSIYRWCTEWNAGRPVGRTSEITREPDGMFAAWGVRSPWRRTRRRGSYCHPQISQSISRRSSACRETSTAGGRGCQSFHKGKARSQRNHAHTPTTGAWVIHERIFSLLEAQTLKTTIVTVISRQETTATRRTRTKRHLEKDVILRDLLF